MENEITYLGFVIKNNKFQPDSAKIDAIKNSQFPATVKGLQRFLGLSNYVSRFVSHYADLSSSLTSLQNMTQSEYAKHITLNREKLELCFQTLKESICKIPYLNLPNFHEKFYLEVDASEEAIGAVLYQKSGPLAFYSRKLTKCEKNYSTIDREFLALYCSIRRFHPYLYGVQFEAFTDHKPLVNFLKHQMQSNRQQRWFLRLQQYDYKLSYIKGVDNVAADCLSRLSVCPIEQENKCVFEKVSRAQSESPIIRNCIDYIAGKSNLVYTDDLSNAIRKCHKLNLKTFSVENDKLYHENRLVVASDVENEIITLLHSCGHFSVNKTREVFLCKYWVPKLRKKIRSIVDNCECKVQKSYGHNPRPSKFPIDKIQNFEVVSLDLVSMPNSRGFNYLLTIMDIKSRLLSAIPLSNILAENVAKVFFKHWLSIYGPPAVLHSDQGTQFVSQVFESLKQQYSIKTSYSSIYHPKGNSHIERIHRTLKDRLRTMGGHWSENIHQAVYDCNRLTGAFFNVYRRTAVPFSDWPNQSDFICYEAKKAGPQVNDFVAIRRRNLKNTVSPQFYGHFLVTERKGNSIVIDDGRQINLHDCVLVGRNEVN